MRARSISRCARNWFSGGSSIARSAISSIIVPPAPKVMTGPKGSSVVRPMKISRPRRLAAIGWMVTPLMRALGCTRRTAASMSLKTSRTCAAVLTFSATPCTSDLWLMSGESIFSATG